MEAGFHGSEDRRLLYSSSDLEDQELGDWGSPAGLEGVVLPYKQARLECRLGSARLLWGEYGPPYWQARLEDRLGSAWFSYCCGLS